MLEFLSGLATGLVLVGYVWPAYIDWQIRRGDDGMTDEDFR
jgi:hypothetical protein